MKDTIEILVVLGLIGLAAWLVVKSKTPDAAGNSVAVPPSSSSVLAKLQAASPYGALTSTVGHEAQAAPTWLKVAIAPVGITAYTQSLIDHPKATLEDTAQTLGFDGGKCSGNCVWATVADAHAGIADIRNKTHNIAGIADCIQKLCNQKFGVNV